MNRKRLCFAEEKPLDENVASLLDSGRSGREVLRLYLNKIRRSRIDERECLRLELMDTSPLHEEISCNLSRILGMGTENHSGLYFQVNPVQNWQLVIGTLSPLKPSDTLTQGELYGRQEATFPCCSVPEIGTAFFQCRNMPWEEDVKQYLLVSMLLEIRKVLEELHVDTDAYFGLAHSDLWMKL